MSPHDIEQMKADREAGVRSWVLLEEADPENQNWMWMGVEIDGVEVVSFDGAPHVVAPLVRRLHRVPDMEAEILRLREALKPFADRITNLEALMPSIEHAVITDIEIHYLVEARRALNGDAP